MKTRTGFVAAVVIGAVMIIGTLALSLPSKTAGVNRLTNTLRPAFTAQGESSARTGFDQIQAMATQLQSAVVPALSKDLHLSPAQFDAFLTKNDPAVATGVSQLGTILPRFGALVTGLRQQRGNFEKADAIALRSPVHLPPTTVPWLLIVPGALVLLLGISGLGISGRPARDSRKAATAIAVIGAVLIIAPFAVSVPAKAKAVDQLTAAFAPTLTPTAVQQTRTDMNTVQAMANQLESKLLPELATALKVTPTQLTSELGTDFPAFALGVKNLPTILPGFQTLVRDLQTVSGSDFNDASSIPWASTATTTLTWLFVIPGALLLIAGCLPFLLGGPPPEPAEGVQATREHAQVA